MGDNETGRRLVGKIALVSGGASGIGAETARQFARHGAEVVVADIDAAGAAATAKSIVSAGGNATATALDVVSEAGWDEVIGAVEARCGRLDVLANIAGISGRGDVDLAAIAARGDQPGTRSAFRVDDVSLDAWNRTMDVNATGVFLGTRRAIVAMRRTGGGSIINISSICGLVGTYANAAYHASKGAVRIFTKAAAVEHAVDRVRVNSVHPGFVDTPMTAAGHSNNAVRADRLDATPLGEFGKPYDIAMGCLYLASDEARWVTGIELVIDGGFTAT